jgi:hypothetical protein
MKRAHVLAVIAVSLGLAVAADPDIGPAFGEVAILASLGMTLGLVALFLVPWLIAKNRGHHQTGAILAVTLLLGWTGIGWIGALIWSLTAVQKSAPAPSAPPVDPSRLPCRACHEPIAPKATICPHCRTELPHEVPPAAKAEPDVYVID